jgi:hypothetical protein
MSEYGTFQILIKSTDAGAITDNSFATYGLNLSGLYELTLKSFQIHIFPQVTDANTLALEIYSPNLLQPYANTRFPTFLYPIDAANKYQGNFDMKFQAQLQSSIQLQIRAEGTKEAIDDLKLAVLNFEYRKIF